MSIATQEVVYAVNIFDGQTLWSARLGTTGIVTGSVLIFAGCSGDDAAQAPSPSTTQSTLNSEILPVPLSTTEADRFLAVTATTGDRYYAAGSTTVNDDSQMAIARFGLTGGLDASFGSNGIATANVAVGADKKQNSRGLSLSSPMARL